MKTKKIKKKLTLNKLTIQNLDHIQVNILGSNEQYVVRTGSEGDPEEITKSLKYCLA